MDEDAVLLSEDLNDSHWITAEEFEEYITNKRMLEDLEKAELFY